MNLTELLDNAARSWPGKFAFVEGQQCITYAQLNQLAHELAAKLNSAGVRVGDRVGLHYPNSVNYVALTFALWRVGAIVVPMPTEDTAGESVNLRELMQLDVVLSHAPFERSVAVTGKCHLQTLSPSAPADNHGLNIAFIRFTSGTTNVRKGVVLCHETVHERVAAANQALRIGVEDTVAWCLPMAHHFLITIVLYLSRGATVVLLANPLAEAFLEAVNRWRITVLYAAPFHYSLLARDRSGRQMPSVRLAVSTTCALPEVVARDFFARYNLPLSQALGVIELGLVSLNRRPTPENWSTVGQPVEGFELRIVSPDEHGGGELAVRGPGLFDAYASPWQMRDLVLHDGWFHTGDIARLDARGDLHLLSRKVAVINLAGRKVYPEEIEAVLNRHPDVRESRVFGRSHPQLGEVVEAELVLRHPDADLATIRAHCRTYLAAFKIPTRWHIVRALPRTATTGKIRRAPAVALND